jgi:hypothetical protein
VFVQQCPELVVVDEAHSCARPAGASSSQQQRFHLLDRIASNPEKQLILLTATPHSGKPEEFHSLLGLLDRKFETLDLPNSSQAERKELAGHFVQRKRADVSKWMGEDTPFPEREAFEWSYELSKEYASFFEEILEFARKLIASDAEGRKQRVNYWTALALLRGVMSSPAMGVKMLTTRLDKIKDMAGDEASDDLSEDFVNPIADIDIGFEIDTEPTQVMERDGWSDSQRRQLKQFAERLEQMKNIRDDGKLAAAVSIIEDWLHKGFKPVVFCRYIETAKYLGELLKPILSQKFKKLG